jgi:hypothetical protein
VSRYRRKPLEVDAVLWDGSDEALARIRALAPTGAHVAPERYGTLSVFQRGWGNWLVFQGSWFVRKPNGEGEVCDPAEFAATYEAAE